MSKAAIQHKTIYYGDCLDWMEKFADECVDLIYLDPPFNSNANYNVIFGKDKDEHAPAQMQAFTDTWRWNEAAQQRVDEIRDAKGHPAHSSIKALFSLLGECGMMSYLSYMGQRVAEMHRILKNTGSLYLHCDATASHYLRLMLDDIFGGANYRNEIVWKRSSGHNDAERYGKIHDVILFYSKSNDYTWTDEAITPYTEEYLESHYKTDENGRLYTKSDVSNPGGGGYEYDLGMGEIMPSRGYSMPKETALKWLEDGELIVVKGKVPRRKKWLDPNGGVPLQDLFTDINPLTKRMQESTGYPTQKPMALLERILKASTNKGDLVLDPFCGCGTTLEAAHATGRKWAGIDVSSFAIDVITKMRMNLKGISGIKTEGIPADLPSAKRLAEEKPFHFETWAIQRVTGMAPNQKQRNDGGVDGKGTMETKSVDSRHVIAQVKGGKYALSHLRDFLHVVERDKAGAGVFITLEKVSSPSAQSEVAKMGRYNVGAKTYPRVQLWSVEEYFEGVECALPPLLDPFTGKPFGRRLQMSLDA